MKKRLLILLPLVLSIILVSTSIVAAQEPTNPEKLLQQIAEANSPEEAFARISPEQKTMVRQALHGTIRVRPLQEKEVEDKILASGSCDYRGVSVDYVNSYGTVLWSYKQSISWCWNGLGITSLHRNRWAEVNYSTLWKFKGHIGNSESGGVGYSNYEAFTQGEFALCFPSSVCTTNEYPWIDQKVDRSGNHYWSSSG